MAASPDLSVVLVATNGYESIRRTLDHLRSQSIRHRLEIVIVNPSAESLRLDPAALEGVFARQVVEMGPSSSTDRARVAGIRRARAPVVALLEDHAYPVTNWAEVLVAAHRGPWVGVTSEIANANPARMLSWVNLLLAYGRWTEPVEGGEVDELPAHNVSYKRNILMEYEATLAELLGPHSGFHQILKARGHRFYLAADTKVYHVNPSRLSSAIWYGVQWGRVYGATRARDGAWSLVRRLLYFGGAPLIPLVRLSRLVPTLFLAGRYGHLWPRILPALVIALVADALGQALGYAFGAGNAALRLGDFESNRLRHVTAWERGAIEN